MVALKTPFKIKIALGLFYCKKNMFFCFIQTRTDFFFWISNIPQKCQKPLKLKFFVDPFLTYFAPVFLSKWTEIHTTVIVKVLRMLCIFFKKSLNWYQNVRVWPHTGTIRCPGYPICVGTCLLSIPVNSPPERFPHFGQIVQNTENPKRLPLSLFPGLSVGPLL